MSGAVMSTAAKYSRFLRDIRTKLSINYEDYPEFTDARIHSGHWELYIIGHGWMTTTDFLNLGDTCEVITK